MVAQETFVTNAAETTLSSSLAAGATTINVTSSSAFPPVPFYAVIDPDVNISREIILVDSAKTATTFTLTAASKRGQDGTTDTSHSSGAKVVCVPVAALWTDINDRVDAADTAASGKVSKAGGDTITASGATVKPLVVKGAAGQSASLLEFQDSAGATLFSIAGGGGVVTQKDLQGRAAFFQDGAAEWFGANINVKTIAAGTRGLVIRGAASQTANLTEFQNSTGTVLLAVTSAGRLLVNALDGTAALGAYQGFINITVAGTVRKLPIYA